MRHKIQRPANTLKTAFGMTGEEVDTILRGSATVARMDFGWGALQLARDNDGAECVVYETPSESFVMNASLPADVMARSRHARRDWVSVLNYSPTDIMVGRFPPMATRVGGFHVVHAGDQHRRNFVLVTLPGGAQTLLFRNPRSRVAIEWEPCWSQPGSDLQASVPRVALPSLEEVGALRLEREFEDFLQLLVSG